MSKRRLSREAGVTLLELLLAVSLVSLLAVGMLFTLRIGLQAMERVDSRVFASRKVIGAQRVLEQQVAGLMALKADCRSAQVALPTPLPFFQGETDTMRFVSSYSLQSASRGVPMMLEFKVIPGELEGVRLVVNEIPYTGPRMLGLFCGAPVMDPVTQKQVATFPPVQIGPQSFVLADQLAYCHLKYLRVPAPPEPEVWRSHWGDSLVPQAIRIEMAPLRPDPSQLALSTFTLPVRVNRNMDIRYAD